MYEGLSFWLAVIFWGFIFSIPFAIWKVIEMIIWIITHVSIIIK